MSTMDMTREEWADALREWAIDVDENQIAFVRLTAEEARLLAWWLNPMGPPQPI